MEKFGIFELLDTLSALTAARESAAAEPEAPAESAPAVRANPNDAVFAPPPDLAAPAQTPPPSAAGNAFTALIARHENISKKIDGKK